MDTDDTDYQDNKSYKKPKICENLCPNLTQEKSVGTMVACTRCGRWHLDAEKVLGKRLSCTDVKQYWSKIRQEHLKLKGHPARISTDDSGKWVCMQCHCEV